MTTSYLAPITELELLGVQNAAVPNKECIVIRANAAVDVGTYALIIARKSSPGHAMPIADSMHWMGSGVITANDWIFVFTGPGTPTKSPTIDHTGTMYINYWGRRSTIFHDGGLVPVLWRLNGITVERTEPQFRPDLAGANRALIK